MMVKSREVEAQSPRSYGRFAAVAPGSVNPEGWLRQFAQTNADGWLLRYARMRDPEVYSLLWDRVQSLQGYWDSSCDFAGYFADGLVRYSHLLPESQLAAEMDDWLRRVLASQDPDGYLGPFERDVRNVQILEAFTIAIVIEALLQHYRSTGDGALLRSCEEAFQPLLEHWRGGGLRDTTRACTSCTVRT